MKHRWGFPQPRHGRGVAPEHLHPLLTVEPPPPLAPLWTQELARRGGAGLRDPCPPLPAPREDGRHVPPYSSGQSKDPRALSFRPSAHLRSIRPMPAQGTHWVYSGGEIAPRCLPSGAHRTIAKGRDTPPPSPPSPCGCGLMVGRVGSEGALAEAAEEEMGGPLLIILVICLFTGSSGCAGGWLCRSHCRIHSTNVYLIPSPPHWFLGFLVCLAGFSHYI